MNPRPKRRSQWKKEYVVQKAQDGPGVWIASTKMRNTLDEKHQVK